MNQHPSVEYYGVRLPMHDNAGLVVKRIDDWPLIYVNPRYDLLQLSQDGYDWGNDGQTAAQVALGIVADVLGDDHGIEVCEAFKLAVIARLPFDGFKISAEAVDRWAEHLERTGVSLAYPMIPGIQALDKPDWRHYMPSHAMPAEWLDDLPDDDWNGQPETGPDGEVPF